MFKIKNKHIVLSSLLGLVLIMFLMYSCNGQVNQKSGKNTIERIEDRHYEQPLIANRTPVFPQIHANLNGMVNEFVRKMYQDSKGNYWFGTNGDGLIRYNGYILEKMSWTEEPKNFVVRGIVEDKAGNVWFGTSDGLTKFDGIHFTNYSEKDGLQNEEIWGLTIDRNGLIWVGTIDGVCQFDGKTFHPFPLPDSMVENPQHMLSDKAVTKIVEGKNGTMWLVVDGNGIFKYKDGDFTHLTKENGLTDNNVADILEDRNGHIWIGTFYGGISQFDGQNYTNFTKDGIIEGVETYNFHEDKKGNLWFSAEHHGVYKFDGSTFTQFTTEDGLTTNGIQSILEDHKGQLWFGTWQGLSVYDGETFTDASVKELWTK